MKGERRGTMESFSSFFLLPGQSLVGAEARDTTSDSRAQLAKTLFYRIWLLYDTIVHYMYAQEERN